MLDELGWRRKELQYLKALAEKGVASAALTRAAVALLYAHWEGFVKTAASAYIEHVRLQQLRLSELKPNFVALGARKYAEVAGQGGRWKFQIEFCEFVRSSSAVVASWPKGWTVDTGANLSTKVFQDIVAIVGASYRSEFQIAEKPTIERLLELRNAVAHGDYLGVDLTEFGRLHDKIDELLVLFCNDLDNAAAMKLYRA